MANTPSIGSFGAILGGGDPVAMAMARRGYDTGILNQVSPASANFQPMPMATRTTTNAVPPQSNPQQMALQQALAQQQAPGASQAPMSAPTAPPPSPETEIILKALTDRLKHHSNLEKQLLGGQ